MTDDDLKADLVAIFSGLPKSADELGTIFAQQGVEGGRVALGNIAIAMANSVAARLDELAARFQADARKRDTINLSADGAPSSRKFH
ncbi:hypothetical protein [Agrobacterium pusense]|uniref:Uncharacterized protein n=1 Tax=Agrobacterium pusense TaxID=648995 RepID=A0AA44EN29_9HYPH|nr:hypothetical protein [Agrobacterium pusense]NRF10860.1 hypothetical protein [Agrobacterium pusense]NRF21570.1 hypothetical protein [Agrobacterium pusense]